MYKGLFAHGMHGSSFQALRYYCLIDLSHMASPLSKPRTSRYGGSPEFNRALNIAMFGDSETDSDKDAHADADCPAVQQPRGSCHQCRRLNFDNTLPVVFDDVADAMSPCPWTLHVLSCMSAHV